MEALFKEETGAEVDDVDVMDFYEFWDGVEADF